MSWDSWLHKAYQFNVLLHWLLAIQFKYSQEVFWVDHENETPVRLYWVIEQSIRCKRQASVSLMADFTLALSGPTDRPHIDYDSVRPINAAAAATAAAATKLTPTNIRQMSLSIQHTGLQWCARRNGYYRDNHRNATEWRFNGASTANDQLHRSTVKA